MGLRDSILGLIPGDAANKVSAAMGKANATVNTPGHVTSGLDQAMRDQADKEHPASPPAFYPKPKYNPNPP